MKWNHLLRHMIIYFEWLHFQEESLQDTIDKYFSLVEVTTSRQLNKVHNINNIAFLFVIKSEYLVDSISNSSTIPNIVWQTSLAMSTLLVAQTTAMSNYSKRPHKTWVSPTTANLYHSTLKERLLCGTNHTWMRTETTGRLGLDPAPNYLPPELLRKDYKRVMTMNTA